MHMERHIFGYLKIHDLGFLEKLFQHQEDFESPQPKNERPSNQREEYN